MSGSRMTYDVTFWTGSPDDADAPEWITCPGEADALIRQACGRYPSAWSGRKAAYIAPMLRDGVRALDDRADDFREFADAPVIDMAAAFLERVLQACEQLPDAVVYVTQS